MSLSAEPVRIQTQRSLSSVLFLLDDNWVRALVFHPSGKFLISASDDKTIRTWDLATGRCLKVLEAHNHFVTTLTWGRAKTAAGASLPNGTAAANGKASETAQVVNVVASGSVDQTIKVCGASSSARDAGFPLTRPYTPQIWLP